MIGGRLNSKDKFFGQCDYRTGRSDNLQMHIKTTHDKIKDFKCKVCPFTTSWTKGLSRHVKRAHENIKEHACQLEKCTV